MVQREDRGGQDRGQLCVDPPTHSVVGSRSNSLLRDSQPTRNRPRHTCGTPGSGVFSHASIEQRPSVPASSVRPASSVKLSHTIDEFTERCQITVICTVCVQTIAHVTASAKAGCRGPTLPDHREYSYRVALSDPLEGSGPAPGPAPLLLVLATADGDGSRAVSGLAFDSVSTAAPRTESESGAVSAAQRSALCSARKAKGLCMGT